MAHICKLQLRGHKTENPQHLLLPEKIDTYLNASSVAILVDVVNAASVEGGRTTDDAVDLEVLESWESHLSNWDIAIGNRHSVSKESLKICSNQGHASTNDCQYIQVNVWPEWGGIGLGNDVPFHWRPRLPPEAFRCESADRRAGGTRTNERLTM